MQMIWVLRHGDQDEDPDWRKAGIWQRNAPLTTDGRTKIAKVRDTHLAGINFHFLGTSPYLRAQETAQIAVPSGNWVTMPALAPQLPEIWDSLFASVPGDPITSLEEVDRRWPGLLEIERHHIVPGYIEVLAHLKDEQNALLVSHQPLLGLLRSTFEPSFSAYDQSLVKGGIYRFKYDRRVLVECDYLPPPE